MSDVSASRLPAIAILGAGSMGGAILAGLRAPGVETEGLRVTNRTRAKAEALAADGVVSLSTEADAQANRSAVRGARVVVLAVKPAMIVDLAREIADALEPEAIVVSVAAGVRAAVMESVLPSGVAVVRAMPNTPSHVGRGVTGLAAGSRATAEHLGLVEAIFATVGAVLTVTEEQLDALGAISGSGPAYVFLLIEEFTRVARDLGFSEADAATLVQQTFLGASELLAASGESPEQLRANVTSPNGTTERAIAVLQDAELAATFRRAVDAAIARTRELADTL